MAKQLSRFDKIALRIAPNWALRRIKAQAIADTFSRNYEAASQTRRTTGWKRNSGDANSVLIGANRELRQHARDLIRNNAYAKKAQRIIANNTIGYGIVPKSNNKAANALWAAWANSTQCDADGRKPFSAIQRLIIRSLFADGEVLVRRRRRRAEDKLAIPLQLEVLEIDYLDTMKDGIDGPSGGPIKQGIEFDRLGKRVAYWLFTDHPGSATATGVVSRRIPATEIDHIFYEERPGQVRGASWLAASIVNLKDFDEYEDAELMKQKIAACFAAFVTDLDGEAGRIGAEPDDENPLVDSLEPGMIQNLPVGKAITFGTPPPVTTDSFATRNLHRVATGLLVPYEDLTGDYSQVNFSSARMSRLAHWANVYDWQFDVLIPQLCEVIWGWAMDAAIIDGTIKEIPAVKWTTSPMPMVEPDKEALATIRQVRGGMKTFSEMIREQGGDPEEHFAEYAADVKLLKSLGIQLDSNVADVSQAGLTQQRSGLSSGNSSSSEAVPEDAPAARAADDFDIDVVDPEVPEDMARAILALQNGVA